MLGGTPATAWQLDAFGHDPQFPGLAADAGLTSSSWARGPFHAWGPFRMPIHPRPQPSPTGSPDPLRMEFPSEFYWVAPSGKKLLTSYMADHYSAGWWMDSALTLEEAEEQTYECLPQTQVGGRHQERAAAGRHRLQPAQQMGEPDRPRLEQPVRLTAVSRWPPPSSSSTQCASAADRDGIRLRPQSRDMNPLYTGKDVSFIDTKQANRLAENALIDAEKFATIASLLGARFPGEAVDKAWRQLLFNAHHDGITGSESDQVYLDLLGGWREAWELGHEVLRSSLAYIGGRIDVPDRFQSPAHCCSFQPIVLGAARPRAPRGAVEGDGGVAVTDDSGADIADAPRILVAALGRLARKATVIFRAEDVPPLGYRTYTFVSNGAGRPAGWVTAEGFKAENERYLIEVDPERGGGISRLYDKDHAKELIKAGDIGNELLACAEYPNHPTFGEGPWHLTPTGGVVGTSRSKAEVTFQRSPIGERLVVSTSSGRLRSDHRDSISGRAPSGLKSSPISMASQGRTPCSGLVSRSTARDPCRCRRWAARSSDGPSDSRRQTPSRFHSRSSIRPTTGSG